VSVKETSDPLFFIEVLLKPSFLEGVRMVVAVERISGSQDQHDHRRRPPARDVVLMGSRFLSHAVIATGQTCEELSIKIGSPSLLVT
jgi:hypothetical protein